MSFAIYAKSISLLPTSHAILPGETATLWTDDLRLVEDALSDNFGVLAVGVMISENDHDRGDQDQDDFDLLQIASLCEIRGWNDMQGDSGYFLTLKCVGRVQLEDALQSFPYCKFSFSHVQDERRHIDKCQLVVENIETFMNKLSRQEKKKQKQHTSNPPQLDGNDGKETENLLQRYKTEYKKALEISGRSKENTTVNSLTATSWAVFNALEKNTMTQHYRLRALDYADLFERLKLAQYMLRENELRLQGQHMAMDDFGSDIDVLLSEGFQ